MASSLGRRRTACADAWNRNGKPSTLGAFRILALNAVGSSSYGKEFADRLLGNWGRGDLQQQIAAVQMLQAQGVADKRVAITGKSYGGYLTAWAIGQTGLFKAAVVSAPVVNLESHMGTSDTGFYVSPYSLGDDPEEVRRRYHDLSPIDHFLIDRLVHRTYADADTRDAATATHGGATGRSRRGPVNWSSYVRKIFRAVGQAPNASTARCRAGCDVTLRSISAERLRCISLQELSNPSPDRARFPVAVFQETDFEEWHVQR